MALSFSPAPVAKLKNLLICFSLGNLCFLRRWYDLEHLKERAMEYYRTGPADPSLLFATLVAASLLAAVFWFAWLWVKSNPSTGRLKLARCVFLLVLIYPLESVRRYWNGEAESPDLGSNISLLAIESVLFIGFAMALFGNFRVVNAARRVTLALTFLLPALLMDFGWSRLAAAPMSAFAAKPSLPMLPPQNPQRRVIWILFDEFDERLAFEVRKPAVDLPEFDRLRAQSFVATHAQQIAGWTTLAVPGLLSGKSFNRADLIDAETLRIYAQGSRQGVSWRDELNVFQQARRLGINAEVVGWHHPYCRILGDSLVKCFDLSSGHPTAALIRETNTAELGVLRSVPFLFRLQWEDLRDIFHSGGDSIAVRSSDIYVQSRHQEQYFTIRDAAFAAAIDPQIGLLYAHFPLPHPLGIYDRQRADFTLNSSLGYADNLALADRTLGELRRKLEQEGLWQSTTILITSDHGLRPSLWRGHLGWTKELEALTSAGQSQRVPFILKLAGQDQGAVYETPFSNVASADLILAILSGQVETAQEAAAWLDQRRQFPKNL